ncbi:MAG: hypothetical protein IJC99_00350 [Clostridia bacterium]|nr:hypothetical protein [Clostridia bacterium]
MFNSIHILYMVISTVITVLILVALRLLKHDGLNRLLIWFFALSTVVIHFSGAWHELFTTGQLVGYKEYLLPIFPCHICMWLLVISATTLNNQSLPARLVRDFTFLGGTVCGSIGILFNFNFDASPTLADFYVLKGLLSHSTMVAGCLLLFVAGYAKIGVGRSVAATLAGIGLFTVDGMIINALFEKYGFEPVNAMFLQTAPFEEYPFININLIYACAILLTLVIAGLHWAVTHKKATSESEENVCCQVQL